MNSCCSILNRFVINCMQHQDFTWGLWSPHEEAYLGSLELYLHFHAGILTGILVVNNKERNLLSRKLPKTLVFLLILCPRRHLTTGAGAPGGHGVRALGHVEVECSSHSVCATTPLLATTDATAQERELSTDPVTSLHVPHEVRITQ